MGTHSNRQIVQFIVLFAVIVFGLTLALRIPFIDSNVIAPYTSLIAEISSHSLRVLGIEAEPVGTLLRNPNFTVDLRRGCDGVVATIILLGACLAFPSNWRSRLWGLTGGYLLIFCLNLLRIIVLFGLGYAGRMELFNLVHTYVAQFIVIISAMVFWVFWAGSHRSTTG